MVKEKVLRENSHERFKRLASQRTQAVLDKIRILGNCSNSYLYDYSEEDVKKIFKVIDDELKRVKSLFDKPKGKSGEFSL